MIFVYDCWTFRVTELKTRFETGRARNEVNGVYSFHLQIICAKYSTYKL
jgi:hypothetical protein